MVGRIRYLCTMLAANKYPMHYEIIEDHSPFYIKFTHPGQAEIIELCQRELADQIPVKTFKHHVIPLDRARDILALLPLSQQISFNEHRVSLRTASPGYRHQVHIDLAPVSINYGISICDDCCETRWYSDRDIEDNFRIYQTDTSRAIINLEDFQRCPQRPVESLRMQQGDAVIFNSSRYHDFDNSGSPHPRCILTLRLFSKNIQFDFLKRAMFQAAL
jgi:hypothetical protein